MRLQLGTTQGRRAWAEPKELGKQRECWKSWVTLRVFQGEDYQQIGERKYNYFGGEGQEDARQRGQRTEEAVISLWG